MGSRLESKSNQVRKRIEGHQFDHEEGEEYEASAFGGFPEYFRRKKIKLQNLDAEIRSQSAGNPQIFKGIVTHVNGYTQPSLNDLHHMVVSHGGGFIQYLDGKTMVTHIIASSLTPKKVVDFRQYRIVKPAWIVDSVNAGKLLPWDNYRVVDEGVGQKVLRFDNGKVSSEINNKAKGYRDQTDTSWYTSQLQKTRQASGEPAISEDGTQVDSLNTIRSSASPVKFQDQVKEEDITRVVEHVGREPTTRQDAGPAINVEQTHSADSGEEQQAPYASTSPVAHDHPSQPRTLLNPHIPLDANALEDDDDDNELDEIEQDQYKPDAADELKHQHDQPQGPDEDRELTAEEHNRILLSDPRIRKSSVLNPDFLEIYYRESRLHHLSAWKAELKTRMQALTAEKSASQRSKQKRPPGARRYVLHVDFDSFFVAVSLKNHPEWIDKPCVVAHGSGSGSEIASCNYPARTFGIKNGIWMQRALEMCREIKVLPYDFPAYEVASKSFYDAVLATGGIVQSVSIDEALVDVTTLCLPAGGTDGVGIREGSIWREQAKAEEIAQGIRDKVKSETGCAVSVGIGGNILLAKVALRKAKPAGQYHVKPDDVLEFIGELKVQDLPGVAYSIGGKLEEIGIKYVKDIREFTRERLTSILGPKTGEKLWNYARGIDTMEVGDQVVRKSVSAEVNWGVRFETQEQAEEFIENLSGELHRRLAKEKVRGRHLTMKIMRRAADAPRDPPKHLGHGKCDTYNKSIMLGVATNAREVIAKEAVSTLRGFGFSPGELRGLGVQMTKLEPLKPVAQADSSQRRLQFKTAPVPPKQEVNKDDIDDDPIQDGPDTPQKPKSIQETLAVPQARSTVFNNADSPSRKPLNTLGTQFILPTQVDPQVLAELPPDIRSRLSKHIKDDKPKSEYSEAQSKALRTEHPIDTLPNQSQLDPDILASLPDDVRAEILAEYSNHNNSPTKPHRPGQSVLPQSPRKTRTLPPSKKPTTRGRPRGSGSSLLSRLKGHATSDTPTLTQSNFVSGAASTSKRAHGAGDLSDGFDAIDGDKGGAGGPGDISADFLAALPDDIRREVLDSHRRAQLKRTANLEVQQQPLKKRRGNAKAASGSGAATSGQRTLKLEPRPAKPSFTTRRLSAAGDLREAVSAWVAEFAAEGPYREDVEALGRYLRSVVVEEGDMGKAVGVVKWLGWVIEGREREGESEKAVDRWNRALERAKACVREAVEERGLGAVDL